MASTSATAFNRLREAKRLPVPHGPAADLVRYRASGGDSLTTIVQAVGSVPSLARFLIRVANLDRPDSAVITLEDACQHLGAGACVRAAIAHSLIDQYRDGPCKCFEYEPFWSRSLATGLAACRLAEREESLESIEAFLAGLLGQIGRLALATVHPGTYARLLAFCGTKAPETLARLEREKYDLDHNDVTAAMLDDWAPPDDVLPSIRSFERQPDPFADAEPDEPRLAPILRLAGGIASVCLASSGRRSFMMPKVCTLAQAAGLTLDEVADVFDRVVTTWRVWAAELALPSHEVPSLNDLMPSAGPDARRSTVNETASGPVPAASPLPESLKVLVVDDCELTRLLLSKQLTGFGHEIETAADGQDALDALNRNTPHIVITDWEMPRLNGLDLCRSLRQARNGRRIVVIVMSGHDSQNDLEQAFEAGADDYIIKPVTSKHLGAHLNKARATLTKRHRI